MKKAIVILSTILLVSVITAAVSAQSYTIPGFQASSPAMQGMMPNDPSPRYECGYFYQDGLRVTDCFDQDGVFLPGQDGSMTNDSAVLYEGYAEDEAARIANPAMMGDFTDDYDAEGVFGDPNGLHFVTKVEYSARYGNYEAEVKIPEIRGMADSVYQDSLNDYIQSVAYDVIDQFENDARKILSEFPNENPYYMVSYDFYIATDTESILTLALEYFTAAGSSYSSTSFFNFNKQTRELILLDDYFFPGSAASNILREEILRQMRQKMMETENVLYWIDGNAAELNETLNWDDLLASVGNHNQYLINEDGNLVIVFNKYDVAPGYMGNPEFIIPMDVEMAMENAKIGYSR